MMNDSHKKRKDKSSVFQLREVSYLYVPRNNLEGLLNGIKEKKLTLGHCKAYFAKLAVTLQHPSLNFTSKDYLPVWFRKGTAENLEYEVLSYLRYDSWSTFETDYQDFCESDAIKVEMPHKIVKFLAKKSSLSEMCVLCVYYLRRMYLDGRGRMSYRMITELSGLRSEAISRAIKSLEACGALLPHPKTLAEHWPTYRYGRQFYDGINIGGLESHILITINADKVVRAEREARQSLSKLENLAALK